MGIGYIFLSCDLGSEKALIDELKTIEGVKEVNGIYGVYDILVKVEVKDEHKLKKILTYKIRKMNQIRDTTTLIEIEGQG